MIDVLIFLIIAFCITLLFLCIFGMRDGNDILLYWCIGVILILVIDWSILRELSVPQHYKIDKTVIFVDKLSTNSNAPTLIFSKKIKVEITSFDMPLGQLLDYENYRIYFDSLTYIDINSKSFDSLDLKYGKKLYKE